MDEKDFKKLIKKNKEYQVLVFGSKILKPSPILHTWLVTINKGKVIRWEFGRFLIKNDEVKIAVFKNLTKPWVGVFYRSGVNFLSRKNPHSKLIGEIDGNKGSIAHKMIRFIEKDASLFSQVNNFKKLGPNCNTFVQWVLKKFPESKLKLPFGAIGRNCEV
jgi:hypothetical protein